MNDRIACEVWDSIWPNRPGTPEQLAERIGRPPSVVRMAIFFTQPTWFVGRPGDRVDIAYMADLRREAEQRRRESDVDALSSRRGPTARNPYRSFARST